RRPVFVSDACFRWMWISLECHACVHCGEHSLSGEVIEECVLDIGTRRDRPSETCVQDLTVSRVQTPEGGTELAPDRTLLLGGRFERHVRGSFDPNHEIHSLPMPSTMRRRSIEPWQQRHSQTTSAATASG